MVTLWSLLVLYVNETGMSGCVLSLSSSCKLKLGLHLLCSLSMQPESAKTCCPKPPAALAAEEPLVYAAPHSEPVAPPRAERAPAPAAKRRKTAAGSKDKSYLPSRGSANYAFLVCLLEVRRRCSWLVQLAWLASSSTCQALPFMPPGAVPSELGL